MNVKNMFYGAILVSAVWAVILLSWFESSLTLSDYLRYESVILIPCLLWVAVYGLGKSLSSKEHQTSQRQSTFFTPSFNSLAHLDSQGILPSATGLLCQTFRCRFPHSQWPETWKQNFLALSLSALMSSVSCILL